MAAQLGAVTAWRLACCSPRPAPAVHPAGRAACGAACLSRCRVSLLSKGSALSAGSQVKTTQIFKIKNKTQQNCTATPAGIIMGTNAHTSPIACLQSSFVGSEGALGAHEARLHQSKRLSDQGAS